MPALHVFILSAVSLLLATSSSVATAEQMKLSKSRIVKSTINVEDMVQLDSKWIIGSSYSVQAQPHAMYFIDIAKEKSFPIAGKDYEVAQDKEAFPNCPGAPDFSKLSTHGLDYYKDANMLYVVNHGQRESIEAFSVERSGKGSPRLRWKGCVIAPSHVYLDAVVGINENELIISNLFDPEDKEFKEKISRGEPTGGLFTWHPQSGLKEIEIAKSFSGPNGILASRDGRYIWVAVWGGKYVARITRTPSGDLLDKSEMLNYMPDNIRWAADGKHFYVGGQAATVDSVFACTEEPEPNCPNIAQAIGLVDSQTLRIGGLLPPMKLRGMGAGTGAIDAGGKYWLTSFKNDSVLIIPHSRAASVH